MEPNLLLYHCNDAERCSQYLSNEDYIILCQEDGDWLGDGMYFWDNKSNAEYWYQKKLKDDSSKEYLIVQSQVLLSKILDLTDEKVCSFMSRLWSIYTTKIKVKENAETGLKLNCLFRYYHDLLGTAYHVIKVFGFYPGNSEQSFIVYDPKKRKPLPCMDIKCIYSVRNKECIISRETVDT